MKLESERDKIWNMAEKVLVIHEKEAVVLFDCVARRIVSPVWDLSNELDVSELEFLKALEKKLAAYIDMGVGEDIASIAMGRTRSSKTRV